MRISFIPRASRLVIGAIAIFTLPGCSIFGPDAIKRRTSLANEGRNTQMDALLSRVPRTPIPCGRVHGTVVDEDSLRLLGNVQVELFSGERRVSGTSSILGGFELDSRDITNPVLRVTRANRIAMELRLTHDFRRDMGVRMTVVLAERGSRVITNEGACLSDNDTVWKRDRA